MSIMMLAQIVSNAHGHELELEVGESKSLYDGSKTPAKPFFSFICNKESIKVLFALLATVQTITSNNYF